MKILRRKYSLVIITKMFLLNIESNNKSNLVVHRHYFGETSVMATRDVVWSNMLLALVQIFPISSARRLQKLGKVLFYLV